MMKSIYSGIIFSLFITVNTYASHIVCTLQESANPANNRRVLIDLSKPLEEIYTPDRGVDVGEDNYSFDLILELDGNSLDINAFFSENNHVQDEVASNAWTVDLSTAVQGQPLVHEELTIDNYKILDFICYYNR